MMMNSLDDRATQPSMRTSRNALWRLHAAGAQDAGTAPVASRGKHKRRLAPRFGERHASPRATQRGFSLVELLIVIVILAIVAAMALVHLNTTGDKADAAADLTRALLQLAQRDAITRQSDVILSLDSVANRIRTVEDYNDSGTIDPSERVIWRTLEEGTHFAPPPMGRVGGGALAAAYAGSALQVIGGLPGVVYRRDGSASSDLEVYLTLRSNVTSEYRAVIVAPSTGRVDIYRYTGAAWVRTTQ